jgi:steroid delta-isomerase-like uncharacterized protein
MRTRTLVTGLVTALVLAACGGGAQEQPPAPPPPTDTTPSSLPTSAPTQDTTPAEAPKAPLADLEKAALKNAGEALNAHDAKKLASVYATDATIKVAGLNELSGRDAIAANMQEWYDAFADMKVGFKRIWMKNDVMILEWVLNGTDTGKLFGGKGKSQQVGHVGLSVAWFDKDGLVKEEHRYGDLGTVAEQVGGKPKPIPALPAGPEPVAPAPNDDANVDVAKALYGALSAKNEADFTGKLADDVTYEGHLGNVKGKADAKKFFATFTKAFPDAAFDVGGAWGVGDYAIVEYTLKATHKGPVAGMPATNRKVSVHAVDVVKVKDGKVQSAQTFSNGLELMTQLGAYKVDLQNVPPAAPPKK